VEEVEKRKGSEARNGKKEIFLAFKAFQEYSINIFTGRDYCVVSYLKAIKKFEFAFHSSRFSAFHSTYNEIKKHVYVTEGFLREQNRTKERL
jgi:hypothetical protein